MSTLTAPGLPPVIVGSRSAGDGRLFLNAGIGATNAVLFAAEKPGEVRPAAPGGLVTALRVTLFTGIAAVLAVLLPIEAETIPMWVAEGWAVLAGLGLLAFLGTVIVDIRAGVLAFRHSRDIKTWRSQLEGALHGHREMLVDLTPIHREPHGADVEDLAAALTQARVRALQSGDGHDLRDLEEKLIRALGAVARYALDNDPGRRDAAHRAATVFERATIEHVASGHLPV